MSLHVCVHAAYKTLNSFGMGLSVQGYSTFRQNIHLCITALIQYNKRDTIKRLFQ